ncbi:MAG: beta-ketoacyl-ACP synthase II [Bacteroidetes bacterium]|nr:beta-ketoacyl-ACP synthase II [Bacteroidota bacterium]
MEFNKVVVTGIGALTPVGNNLEAFWSGLKSGVSGACPITKFDTEPFKTKFACELKGFDVLDHIDRKEARRMDPYTHYALVASEEAIMHSGLLDYEGLDRNEVGVIWASGIGGILSFQKEIMGYAEMGKPRFNPFFIPKMIPDIAAGHISIKHGFRGPNYATVSACASATNALIDALMFLQLGKADAIVVGGSEMAITEGGIGGFNAMRALSTRNDDPATASRPFDPDRDGFVMGEGGGSLVLETEAHALKRGATIYAEFAGGGLSADAHHMTAPHPEGLGASLVMERTCRDAGIDPTEIDYINVHGTSTPLGDISEVKAIERLLGDDKYKVNISSTKSMTGHLLGAAGIVEAIACVMSLREGIIPPTINHFTDDPELDPKLNFTFNEAQERDVNIVLSNTFGFGGHNASVVFKKYIS